MLEKTNRVNMLFDFYDPLLKERQREFLEMYYEEDLSLSEIAELTGVSRQAVYDQLKRTEAILEQYEEHLRLLAKYTDREKLLKQLHQLTEGDHWNQEAIRSVVNELVALELELD